MSEDHTTIRIRTEHRKQLKMMKQWRSYDQLIAEMIRQYDETQDESLELEA